VVYKFKARLLSTEDISAAMVANSVLTDPTYMYSWDTALFRCVTPAYGPQWVCEQGYSSARYTRVETGVPLDTAWHVFKIEMLKAETRFYIDGDLVATITSNIRRHAIPAFHTSVALKTHADVQKQMKVSWLVVGLVW